MANSALFFRCLEGLFDTWGVFGQGFNNNLTLGGPTPIGARKANLSQEVASHLAEVALNEQVWSSDVRLPAVQSCLSS